VNRFNLTFSGEILAGHDPAQVKRRFGKMFAIDDPVRLDRFFNGQTIILRRNLERKAAAQYYHELHLLGVNAALVKVSASETADAVRKVSPLLTTKVPKTSRRDKTDIAAQIKARKKESLRLAAEQAARDRAIQEEQQRSAAANIAREQARAAEIRRSAQEETARREAERAEVKRREVEEAARQKALREQQKAERERLKAEAAARRRAELEAMRRRETEEATRLQAEQEEIQRQEAAEAARLQAELEQIKRQEAAEAARIKAEAQRKEAEAQRQSAERRRAAAQQLAAKRALRKEEKRRVAAQQTTAARHKAEELHMAALEQQEQAALSEALREKAMQRGAEELTHPSIPKPPKPPKARIRTSLEVPQRKTAPTTEAGAPAPRKRQPGEPNLYMLRPFRNTDDVRARAAQAHRRMRQGYTLGAIALAALLIVGGSFLRQTATPVIAGATAMVIDPKSGPLLLAGERLLFHDRAGVSTRESPLSDLGLSTLTPPLDFDSSGALLALGRLAGDSADTAGEHFTHLLRCELVPPRCEHFSSQLQDSNISAFVIHPLDGSLLLADAAAGELLKITRTGQIVARAAVAMPAQPVLRLHGGLLLMNSADGPAISVLRYEDKVFGQQLDEILLLPPSAQQTAQSRVGDFLWSSGTWWASLHNPVSGSVGLYHFDEKWNYLDEVELPAATGPLQLVSWGEKTLVNDPRRPAALRFNAQRAVEAPFVSTLLADLVAGQQRGATLTTSAWRTGMLLCALGAAVGFGFGYLQHLRRLVYKPQRERGAEPVDDYVDALQWIDPVQNRLALLRRRSLSYGLLVLGMLLLAIAQSVTVWQLAALLLALSGPAIALLLSRYPVGHIGVMQDKLLLVDHRGVYHLAVGSGVQYHGPFLLIDDVVVFSGSHLLPAFAPPQLQKLVRPLALGGVKVDRNTIVVKLLQCLHPFALGACAILAAAVAAAILLCLHGIF